MGPVTTTTGRTAHIFWRQYGEDPTILLLHGFTDSGACWEPIIPALQPFGGILTLDARGHGESGLPPDPYGAADQAKDAAAVLEDRGLRDVVVMGHSMGGANAIALAYARPDLVRALILEDPYIQKGVVNRSRSVPDSLRAQQQMSLTELIDHGRAERPDWEEDEFAPWAEAKQQFNLEVFGRRGNDPSPDVAMLADLTVPVLLLHGDAEHGSIVDTESLQAAGDHVTAVRIAGAGHSLRRERRGPFLDAVTGFLEGRRSG